MTATFDSAAEPQTATPGVGRNVALSLVQQATSGLFTAGLTLYLVRALGPTDFHAYVEVMLSSRWYLFDPSGVSPPMGLVRLGTGRDAADAAFATVFGLVRSTPPVVEIEAITGGDGQLVMPTFSDELVLSTSGLEWETVG